MVSICSEVMLRLIRYLCPVSRRVLADYSSIVISPLLAATERSCSCSTACRTPANLSLLAVAAIVGTDLSSDVGLRTVLPWILVRLEVLWDSRMCLCMIGEASITLGSGCRSAAMDCSAIAGPAAVAPSDTPATAGHSTSSWLPRRGCSTRLHRHLAGWQLSCFASTSGCEKSSAGPICSVKSSSSDSFAVSTACLWCLEIGSSWSQS